MDVLAKELHDCVLQCHTRGDTKMKPYELKATAACIWLNIRSDAVTACHCQDSPKKIDTGRFQGSPCPSCLLDDANNICTRPSADGVFFCWRPGGESSIGNDQISRWQETGRRAVKSGRNWACKTCVLHARRTSKGVSTRIRRKEETQSQIGRNFGPTITRARIIGGMG
jgi:hypothetical protein